MESLGEGSILRIFMGENDRHEGKPLYEWIVVKAREKGLAGATVLRGMMGFGARGRLHSFKIHRLSQALPVIVELVDVRNRLESFLASLGETIEQGMVTLEAADIRFYRSGKKLKANE